MGNITVIGHFDWKENNMIGAVVKARNIHKELKNQFPEQNIGCVDIYNWKQRKIIVLLEIVKAFFQYKNIVLVISDTSTLLMSLFKILKKIFCSNILYAVVGGDIAELLSQNKEKISALSVIDSFFVETRDCLQDMHQLGFDNTYLMYNFKHIKSLNIRDISDVFVKPFRFCTFSRVIAEKGIIDAVNAINQINEEYKEVRCCLDIYGSIDEGFKTDFQVLINNNENIKYCGVVDSEHAVETICPYYCLLFPTKYQTEGIPGTIIDSFASGVPVITSNWKRCNQMIVDGVNGLVYPFNDYEAFVEKIKFSIENPEFIKKLKKACVASYEKYEPGVAIIPLLEHLE